ncbi:MAG: response regulator [Anaerolineae bacterium]|nr:response regulator [Anaerolineae bacterium]
MAERENLLAELHRALAHLDDPPYLEKHPLATRLSFVAQTPELSRGRALRRALRLAIAALDPGTSTNGAAVEARSYQVLYRWAVARQGMVAIANSLGISRRQAYRELRRAEEALAQVLGGPLAAAVDGTDGGAAPTAGRVEEELERLTRASEQDVDLDRLLREAVESVTFLARDTGASVNLRIDAGDIKVAANRVMLRQAILNLLSHAVSAQQGGGISVHLRQRAPYALVEIAYRQAATSGPPEPKSPYAVAGQLLSSLGIGWTHDEQPGEESRISLRIPLAGERVLLIVDDNEGLVALFRGYLRRQPFRIYAAETGDRALELVQSLRPDVVILDVMMPDRDGWEVLQELRATEAGARARIIVCSIINDPKLALALGADAFLNKPVDRASLLQALGTPLSGR